MGIVMSNLEKQQRIIDGMMKEITYNFEINNPEIRLSGTPTEVSTDVDVFQLNPARKIREHYGNSVYVDRVKISPDITFKTLKYVCNQMVLDFRNKYPDNTIFIRSFMVPGNAQEWCRQTELGDLEIRLFCKFEKTA